MKRFIIFPVLLLLAFTGCGKQATEGEKKTEIPEIYSAADFAGKKISAITGATFDKIIEDNIPGGEPVYFNNNTDALAAIEVGKIDAILDDDAALRRLAAKNLALKILEPYVTDDKYGIVVSKGNDQLMSELNRFIGEIKANGLYDDMMQRWLDAAVPPPMPSIGEGTEGILRFGTGGTSEGFSYFQDGEIAGFDIEFAKRIAERMNMKLEITIMDFGGLIPAVQSGKVDFAANLFTITEERKKSIDFTEPYYTGGAAIAVFTGTAQNEAVSFWQGIKTSFERNLIAENRWKMIVDGLGVSMVISIFAFILATLLGFGVCGLCMSKNPILRCLGGIYTATLRGTPIVVLLMITFYVVFAKVNVSSVLVAIIAFGANGGAFIGEIIRSSILTVDKGQVEAARSMGFSKVGTFFTVTLPQAAKVAFPVYKSEFISMFKMTSIVGYIAIVDLTKAGDIIRSRTYDAFFPLIVVALVYLVSASLMVLLFDFINRMTDSRLRRSNR